MLYTTLERVRNFGVSLTVPEEEVWDAIALASVIIDDYCNEQMFPTDETLVMNDVRLPIVHFPKLPFSNITEVKLNTATLDPSSYTVEKWGLRLYIASRRDVDGFPLRPLTQFGVPSVNAVRGSQVSVTATFGHPSVSLSVTRACTILSARITKEGASSLVPDTRLKTLSVEGYTRTWDISGEKLDTTGDAQADRLLRAYRSAAVQVG